MTDRQRTTKALANLENADRYTRRNRSQRKQARRQRVEQREVAWLAQMGLTRNHQPLA
jgi:hypothetical protein